MSQDPLFILVILSMAAVLIVLMIGIGGFGRGGEFNMGRHTTGTRTVSRDQRRCIASAERQAKSTLAAVIEEQRRGG